ncbi:hypothetical protein SETIT_4G054500v2 [Setaria italica]|uniref:Uncharacterized protein n=1 Tax=Setaria italica TaxID=4555 RepID=A0A368QR43_SETIT|nr:hypothetical protein SETIT_4G054500v2 [Setaria italica]
MCHHDVAGVVQLFDGYGDGSWRFFRCPYGLETAAMRSGSILHFLSQPKITSTTSSARSLTSSAVIIAGDLICTDSWCKCPYHHYKDCPPSPPSFGGAGYYEVGPSQLSQS